jgi:hypothetical protein
VREVRGDTSHPACSGLDGCTLRREAVVPPVSGVAAACLWRRARRLCPSTPLMPVSLLLVYRALVEVRENIPIPVVLCLTLPPTQLYLYL